MGNRYLAYRLQDVFKKIVTPEDVALHNKIVDEISIMVGGDKNNLKLFFDGIAEIIVNKPKQFLKKVAEKILQIITKG
ncbi:MAG: hypothetical protein PHY02_09765 [Phycisphaerae bacterium]|nr:hypothetical protein [Phycisphaerae bacterium]